MEQLISRQAAIDALYSVDEYNARSVKAIKELPSAQSEIKQQAINSSDCIDRRAALDALRKMQTYKLFSGDDMLLIDQAGAMTELMLLPPAEPKRGKWIYHIDDLFPAESTMECNQCHAEQPLICDDEFCPNCGAKMEVTG